MSRVLAGAAKLDVRLQEESLDLAALRILLLSDQMERQLKGGRRGHPPLQVVELEARGAIGTWMSRARCSGRRHDTYGTITVRRLRMANTRSVKTRIATDSKRFQELKADLARIEYFSKGTVLARMIKCGKPKCPCGADPKKRHGPYFEWTYKEQGKTVNVRLTAEAAPLFQAASKQYRKLKSTLARLEKLSRQAITRLAKEASSRPRN